MMADPTTEAFVRLNRRFFRNFLWKEERAFSRAEAWLDLVQMAAYEEQKKMVADELIELPRGGIVASERFLSDRWMWSRTKVRVFLKLLLDERMIARPDNKLRNTLLVLRNFDKHNPRGDARENHARTSDEPATNQIKERKERKESEKSSPREMAPSPALANNDSGGGVDEIWQAHDWQSMSQDEAFGLLRDLFPNIDVWGEFTRYKELRSAKGQQPTWRPFLGWLRKATPVMNLGRKNPARQPARLPASDDWQRFIADEYPDARDPGPARDAPASLLAEFAQWQARHASQTSR